MPKSQIFRGQVEPISPNQCVCVVAYKSIPSITYFGSLKLLFRTGKSIILQCS